MIPVILLLGAPGSGKGTQASNVSNYFGFRVLSTGDLIRDQISAQTKAGKLMKQYLDNGQLIPDSFIMDLLSDILTKDFIGTGIILDGVPRTVFQAKLLKTMLGSMEGICLHIFFFRVSLDTLIERISGRVICETCKRIYHLSFNPPKNDNICDVCQTALTIRSDDNVDILLERYRIFNKNMGPIINFYSQTIHVLDANKSSDHLFTEIKGVLES